MVVILGRTVPASAVTSALFSVSAMPAMPAMSVTEHMHAHKEEDDQNEEPVFSYPFHCIHRVG
jgi:hypothetical protein